MSGLVKAAAAEARDARSVRATDAVRDQELEQLRRRVAGLETEIVDRDRQIRSVTKMAEQAFADGEFAARSAMADDEARRLASLEDALETARQQVMDALAGAERLGASLARDCLAKLFDETQDRAALVHELIRHKMTSIELATILVVEVSAKDFCAEKADDLAGRIGGIRVIRNDAWPSGACQMKLRLGQIDIGLEQQWGTLERLLSEFSGGLPS